MQYKAKSIQQQKKLRESDHWKLLTSKQVCKIIKMSYSTETKEEAHKTQMYKCTHKTVQSKLVDRVKFTTIYKLHQGVHRNGSKPPCIPIPGAAVTSKPQCQAYTMGENTTSYTGCRPTTCIPITGHIPGQQELTETLFFKISHMFYMHSD